MMIKTYGCLLVLLLCPASLLAETATTPIAPSKLPAMTLSKQFSGPLQDTAIQRFVDTETGVVCYLYTPYVVPSALDAMGRVIYNANGIGNISCVAPWKDGALPTAPKK